MPGLSLSAQPPDDIIRPFQVEGAEFRGRLARLGGTVDDIIRRHEYPPPISQLLGEAVTLACLLAGALKFDGIFSLQAKGDGPVHMLLVDFVSPGVLRGYVQFNAEALAEALSDDPKLTAVVPRLLGKGHLSFTVDHGEDSERTQGIVALEGATLTDCAHNYFRESEQVQTAIRLAAAPVDDGGGGQIWRAGGLMVQRLPEGDPALLAKGLEFASEEYEDAWRRAVTLLATAQDKELTDPELSADELLYRLYHEDGIRVFRPVDLRFGCRCSADRAEWVLRSLSSESLKDMTVDGQLIVTCEFCSSAYPFEAARFV